MEKKSIKKKKKVKEVALTSKDTIITSSQGKMTTLDWQSLFVTLLMVAGGAVVTKLIEILPGITVSDTNGQIIMGFVIMLLKFIQKLLSERKYVT